MAIMIGDMPPWLLVVVPAGGRAPRGPFCMPLSTSINPIVASIGLPGNRQTDGPWR
jgi:hypothetical protein